MYILYLWVIVSYNPLVHQTVYKWEYAGTYQTQTACKNAVNELPGLDPATTRCIKTYSKE